ncbi:MAG TPA: hypothetical protein VJP78_12110 [Thermoleophilia bacterium]|nr:hypothetical protein [Thermoleophilia bacterium]
MDAAAQNSVGMADEVLFTARELVRQTLGAVRGNNLREADRLLDRDKRSS